MSRDVVMSLDFDEIEVPNGRRAVDPAAVKRLAASIKKIGLRHPITVRLKNYGGYVLVAGRHRLEAYRNLGIKHIPATISAFSSNLEAELWEIDENLCRSDLTPAQEAAATARRKQVYEELHPDTKAGIAGGKARQGSASDNLSFAESTAEATGKSTRTIERAAARGTALDPATLGKIVGTSLDNGVEIDALARISEPGRAELIGRAAAGEKVSAKVVVKQERRAERERVLGNKQRALPNAKYGVILADPPWGRTVYSADTGMDRHAANHYPTPRGDEETQDDSIKALSVASIAADDCVLGLWCTDVHRGVDVMRAWGFEPKTYFVWVKDVILADGRCAYDLRNMFRSGDKLEVVGVAGTGFWRRDRAEIMLIGVRGHPVCPAPGLQGESVWFAPRGEHTERREDRHSDKPEISFCWFEYHWRTTPKIELYARRKRKGWVRWGNEADVDEPAIEVQVEAPARSGSSSVPISQGMLDHVAACDPGPIPEILRRYE